MYFFLLKSTPGGGPKGAVGGHGEERRADPVRGVLEDGVAPPRLDAVRADRAVLRELQAEEDDDRRDRETRVQAGGEYVYVERKKLEWVIREREGSAYSCTWSTRKSCDDG